MFMPIDLHDYKISLQDFLSFGQDPLTEKDNENYSLLEELDLS